MGWDGTDNVRLTGGSVERIESLLWDLIVEIRKLRNDLKRRAGETEDEPA